MKASEVTHYPVLYVEADGFPAIVNYTCIDNVGQHHDAGLDVSRHRFNRVK